MHHSLALCFLLVASAPASRVLAQARLPAPLAAALAELDDGYLVDYDVVADLKMFGRVNRNHGQLMQPGASPERVSVNNQTGYVAVRRGDTIETVYNSTSKPVRYFTTLDDGLPTVFFRNFFRPEQTPIEVRTLPGPFEVATREGAVVTYRSPSPVTRLPPGAEAKALTEVSVDTVAREIVAVRVREYAGQDLATDVVWRYSGWRDDEAAAAEFDIGGDIVEAPRSGRIAPPPLAGPTVRDLIGESAPAIAGTGPDSEAVRLSPKRVVLFFSATWCGPCKAALSQLNERDFRLRDGYELVYVNRDDTADKLGAYFGEHFGRLPDRVITDADEAFGAYNVRGIPTMVEIDERGVITGAGVGSEPSYISGLMAAE